MARQDRAYVYFADLWRQPDADADADFESYARVYERIRCQFVSSPDDANPSPVGRTRHDLFVTLDEFRFDDGTVIRDMDALQMVDGPAGALLGEWWAIRGNGQPHGWRAKCVVCIGAQGERPMGAP